MKLLNLLFLERFLSFYINKSLIEMKNSFFSKQHTTSAYGDDINFLFQRIKNRKCGFINEPLVFYRTGSGITAKVNATGEGYVLHHQMIRRWVDEQEHCEFSLLEKLWVIGSEYRRMKVENDSEMQKKILGQCRYSLLEKIVGEIQYLATLLPKSIKIRLKYFLSHLV